MVCRGCDAQCAYREDDLPCWGPIQVVDAFWDGEDYCYIHACSGHAAYWDDWTCQKTRYFPGLGLEPVEAEA